MYDRAIGIDPSWECTGIGTVGAQGMSMDRVPAMDLDNDGSVRADARHIGIMAGRVVERVRTMIYPGERVLFVIEGPAMAARYGRPDERAGIRWIITYQLGALYPDSGCAYMVPTSLKKFWTDHGHAEKKMMVGYTEARYPHLVIPDHNANDGFALAVAGAVKLGIIPMPGPPMVYLPSLETVRWPSDMQEA